MAFGLTIGTERAIALQNAIQDELTKRGFSPDADPVMAEYITIMIINNKTAVQIATELEDLIGTDFDSSFVDWLFAEAAKGAPESEVAPPTDATSTTQPPEAPTSVADNQRRPPNGPRSAPLYQQALSQALPSGSPTGQKRPASARSPSPNGHPPKARRLDPPSGPRAMFRDGHGPRGDSRSLLDRVGPARNGQFPAHDDIQVRIDNITGSPDPNMMMMGGGGFPMNGMGGMDMGAMGMANPLMLQEMMLGQMAMMSQLAGAMGILPQGQFMNGGFPMQPGMGGDMGMFNNMGGPQGGDGRGRGRGRGGASRGRGRGGHHHGGDAPVGEGTQPSAPPVSSPSAPAPAPANSPSRPAIVAPKPNTPAPPTANSSTPTRPGFVPLQRPQSPTLCKFSLKCTNPLCRYSHPSPVATPESGVVLSNDPCEKGRDCKDKDCIKAHISPAALNPNAEPFKPVHHAPSITPSTSQGPVPCKFGAACTRPGCTFAHPTRPSANTHYAQPCRFGTACTRAACAFTHPEGRVLPSSFHRGLSTTGPLVTVPTPETGSMGAAPASHNKSVTFKKESASAELDKKLKEIQEAQKAVAQAQAAAHAGKKDDGAAASKTVPISA